MSYFAAGGDLQGTFPNASVAKIRGVTIDSTTPVAGKTLVFGAGEWQVVTSPVLDINAAGQSYPLDHTKGVWHGLNTRANAFDNSCITLGDNAATSGQFNISVGNNAVTGSGIQCVTIGAASGGFVNIGARNTMVGGNNMQTYATFTGTITGGTVLTLNSGATGTFLIGMTIGGVGVTNNPVITGLTSGGLGNVSSEYTIAPASNNVGPISMTAFAIGNDNVAVGVLALNKVLSTGSVALGQGALQNITVATGNTAIGFRAGNGMSLAGSLNNTAIGYESLRANAATLGHDTAVGYRAMELNAATGNYCTAIGVTSLQSNSGNRCVGIGMNSLNLNSGDDCVGIGNHALFNNTGDNNIAVGTFGMELNTTGERNVAMGFEALTSNRTGSRNIALGYRTGTSNATGSDNSSIGSEAGADIIEGSGNTAIGPSALKNYTILNTSTAVGSNSQAGVTTATTTFTGTLVGTTLTVTAASGPLYPGSTIFVSGTTNGTYLLAITAGTPAGPGSTWTVALGSATVNVGPVAMSARMSAPAVVGTGQFYDSEEPAYPSVTASCTGTTLTFSASVTLQTGQPLRTRPTGTETGTPLPATYVVTGGTGTVFTVNQSQEFAGAYVYGTSFIDITAIGSGSVVAGMNIAAVGAGTGATIQTGGNGVGGVGTYEIVGLNANIASGAFSGGALPNLQVGNSSLGNRSMMSNAGANNTGIGDQTLLESSIVINNTCAGYQSGMRVNSNGNTFVGTGTGNTIRYGNSNVAIGGYAMSGVAGFVGYTVDPTTFLLTADAGYVNENMVYPARVTGGAVLFNTFITGGITTTSALPATQSITVAPFTLDVVSTVNFPSPIGRLTVITTTGAQEVTYTGTTATSFTGCVGTGSFTVDALSSVRTSLRSGSRFTLSIAQTLGSVLNTVNLNVYSGIATVSSSEGNIAIGWVAAGHITTGGYNTFMGYAAAAQGQIVGNNNIGIGLQSLFNLTSGSQNICIGERSGGLLTTGSNTIAIGKLAGFAGAGGNICIGESSGRSTPFGGNVFVGNRSGPVNTGNKNTFVGDGSGPVNTGSGSIFLGWNSGIGSTTGGGNIAIGTNSKVSATGDNNISIGSSVGGSTGAGINNICIGGTVGLDSTGAALTDGYNNTFVGIATGAKITTGFDNTFVGRTAGAKITTGNYNTLLGNQAGQDLVSSASFNTFVGYQAGSISTTGTANICIGNNAQPSSISVSNEITLGDINITGVRFGSSLAVTQVASPSNANAALAGVPINGLYRQTGANPGVLYIRWA